MVSSTDGQPVGVDRDFFEMGDSATSLELPSGATTHAMADPAHAIRVAAEHGTRILSPEETCMPNYPWFDAIRP